MCLRSLCEPLWQCLTASEGSHIPGPLSDSGIEATTEAETFYYGWNGTPRVLLAVKLLTFTVFRPVISHRDENSPITHHCTLSAPSLFSSLVSFPFEELAVSYMRTHDVFCSSPFSFHSRPTPPPPIVPQSSKFMYSPPPLHFLLLSPLLSLP